MSRFVLLLENGTILNIDTEDDIQPVRITSKPPATYIGSQAEYGDDLGATQRWSLFYDSHPVEFY
jgi:hypothetical protein